MHRLVAAALIVACLGCATTQSVGTTTTIYTDRDRLWLAAQGALQDIGARIVVSNRSTGTLVGRLDVEGTPIELTVSISGSPAPGERFEGYWDVNVRGALVGDSAPDEEWQRRLTYFEDQVMERVNAAALTGGRYVR